MSKKLPTKISDYETPVPFEETFKWPGGGRSITFTAKSYMKWAKAALPIMKTVKACHHSKAKEHGIPVGDEFIFYVRPLPIFTMERGMFGFGELRPTRSGLGVWRGTTEATARFDDVVNIPILASKGLTPWMSLTPNECFTLRGMTRRAKGNVAVAGLGLGWSCRKILERKQVKHLTVVEENLDVINVFGESLKADFGDRITFVNGDAYEFDWLPFDVSLWDIWRGYGDASDDDEFIKIRQLIEDHNKVCIGWGQGVWSQSQSYSF